VLKKGACVNSRPLWKRIAEDLEKSTRNRRLVNLSSLKRFTKENETVVVPGKVLGSGEINHKLTVAAFAFSQNAKVQIEKANGKCITIKDLLKQNPQGKDVKIVG